MIKATQARTKVARRIRSKLLGLKLPKATEEKVLKAVAAVLVLKAACSLGVL